MGVATSEVLDRRDRPVTDLLGANDLHAMVNSLVMVGAAHFSLSEMEHVLNSQTRGRDGRPPQEAESGYVTPYVSTYQSFEYSACSRKSPRASGGQNDVLSTCAGRSISLSLGRPRRRIEYIPFDVMSSPHGK
jgi:hypothetical protein